VRHQIEIDLSPGNRKKRLGPAIRHADSRRKEVNTEVNNLIWKIRGLLHKEEGQGMVEYALILVLVSIVVIVILLTMGNQIRNVFSNVIAALNA
jgi:pilus assembly protein Flp/PilA